MERLTSLKLKDGAMSEDAAKTLISKLVQTIADAKEADEGRNIRVALISLLLWDMCFDTDTEEQAVSELERTLVVMRKQLPRTFAEIHESNRKMH
jgi:hypothetical protein